MTEAHHDIKATRRALLIPILPLLLSLVGLTARADKIILRGGGQLKGKLIPDPAHPGQSLFLGESGKTPMVFKQDQIVQVSAEKSGLDEYVILLAKERPTAEAEFELGAWCDAHKLTDLAVVHYELAVRNDRTYEPAHRKLGHVLLGGRWLDFDEVKVAQGMVKFKGRWMTPEEKERREMLATSAAEGNAWVKRIRALREGYLNGPIERSKEAERRLLAIDTPQAIGPILKILGEDPVPSLRILAARIVGPISSPEATAGLVGRLLAEEDEAVRQATISELSHRDLAEVVPLLTRGLRSTHHDVVNRSGWALGVLNASLTVPKLIPALVTIESEVVIGDAGPGFNAASPAPGFASYSGGSYPVLSAPVVGPGVVGYGATAVPYGPSAGSSIGGGPGASRGPVSKLVQVEHRNDEVLAALVKLTGHDFGYDIASWKRWVATSFKVETAPSRRVREP